MNWDTDRDVLVYINTHKWKYLASVYINTHKWKYQMTHKCIHIHRVSDVCKYLELLVNSWIHKQWETTQCNGHTDEDKKSLWHLLCCSIFWVAKELHKVRLLLLGVATYLHGQRFTVSAYSLFTWTTIVGFWSVNNWYLLGLRQIPHSLEGAHDMNVSVH